MSMRSVAHTSCAAARSSYQLDSFPIRRQRVVRVRAEQPRDEGSSGVRSGAAAPAKPAILSTVDRMLTRYDFLSTGCGALCVTGYCVMKGQDPATAAAITVTATVVALVANELMYDGRQG